MLGVILVVHAVVSLAIVVLVLLQRGPGADAGASFGAGSSQTFFGAGGSGNVLSHITTVLVAIFFAASFSVALLAKQSIDASLPPELPAVVDALAVPELERPSSSSPPSGDLPDAPSAPTTQPSDLPDTP